jgi:hypothetical protein
MDRHPTHRAALEALASGYEVVLLKEGRKEPWRTGWNERVMEATEVDYWMRRYPLNYGILLRGLCVLDKDGRSKRTTDFLKGHRARSPMEVRTYRGTHIYLRLPAVVQHIRTRIKWLGLGLDVKCTGCVVGPGSQIAESGWTYRFKSGKRLVPKDHLPEVPNSISDLLQAENSPPATTPPFSAEQAARRGPVRHPEAYVLTIRSIQGQNGSGALVRAVCVMRDAGRSALETVEYLSRVWSPACAVPEWSEAEIGYAVRRHFIIP